MNEDLRQKAMALEIYNQQLQMIQSEIASIRTLKSEIMNSIKTIESIDVDEETLIPVGPGVFLKAKIVDDKALIGVKSDIYVEKPFNEVVEDLKKSVDDLDKAEKEGMKKAEELAKAIAALRKELQAEIQKAQQAQEKKE
ncbi:prefoldin subunit alpha [Methanocaldococcus fervens]|uniref:Prefoldin subunit alpha n=1 Tax=Methanocaldococcus fervens (strain DSM 4213 / JCM 15782 / AG86) TaxID=573064 RepID=C7P7X7_METFA|nr:prefoldin subunit alpha [Methanocaldococcus fervens]ACV24659.1 prefoldin, alpha subunit [Methanocaldococcus fervens AG86]